VFGVGQRREPEQRVDRGQPRVAGADAGAALALEVVDEAGDQRRVEVGEIQRRGGQAGLVAGVTEQQSQGVTVGGDGVAADVALPDEPVGVIPNSR
jgi:hypothetical protein